MSNQELTIANIQPNSSTKIKISYHYLSESIKSRIDNINYFAKIKIPYVDEKKRLKKVIILKKAKQYENMDENMDLKRNGK